MPYPERGPAILFFTGGTALRALSHKLKQLTTRSIHLLSPFDSGGSSASLRDAFNILSVGDIRNRMTALVDTTTAGNYFARLLDDRFARQSLDTTLLGFLTGTSYLSIWTTFLPLSGFHNDSQAGL